MRLGIRSVVAVVVVSMALPGGCDSDSAAGGDSGGDAREVASGADLGVEDLRPKAAQITDWYADGNWTAIRDEFDDNMRRKLAADGLANAWKQVTGLVGEFKARDEPTQVPKLGAYIVFDTPMHFERGDMKSRVAFDADGRIAGLFILQSHVP